MSDKKSQESDIALRVEHISKSFRLPHEQASGLKQAFINRMRGIKGYSEQHVLRDISFEINKGDFFGIVGRNGSGKSTLLKLISQIYTPDKGKITVNGSLVPFIELGVGFNPELTGRENVYLNGAMLGFSKEEIEAMYDEIVEFAELHDFMDQKLKNYSSGMQVRLAFSVAIKAQGDILVLDEVLAVGDEAFQRKCYQYFAQLKKQKKTVILVTHSMDSVQRFCNKAMLINSGEIIESGNPARVAEKYLELNEEKVDTKENNTPKMNERGVSAEAKIENTGDSLIFDIEVSAKSNIDDAVVTLLMNNETGESVYRWASDDLDSKATISIKAGGKMKLRLELENIFPDGKFDIQLAVKRLDRSEIYGLFNQLITFRLVNRDIKRRNIHWKPKEKYKYEQN